MSVGFVDGLDIFTLQTNCKNHSIDLRAIENYDLDIQVNNPSETGIR